MIQFRTLKKEDFPLMHKWLNSDHVHKWWDDQTSIKEIEDKYTPRLKKDSNVHCYIMVYDQVDIGMIQYYLETDDVYEVVGSKVGIDLFIGEQKYLYKAIGPRAIKAIIESLIVPNIDPDYICIDPDARNDAAIKAYSKVGFKSIGIKTCRSCQSHKNNYMVLDMKKGIE